jgi:hypothetical protein
MPANSTNTIRLPQLRVPNLSFTQGLQGPEPARGTDLEDEYWVAETPVRFNFLSNINPAGDTSENDDKSLNLCCEDDKVSKCCE